jgi:hypothetical protein
VVADIRAGRIDILVGYKVDRLTRSLADFARLVEIFDAEGVSFVSVTQQFNTTSVKSSEWRSPELLWGKFARDSPLEQRGFELVVPPRPARGATTSECADALSAPSMSTGG